MLGVTTAHRYGRRSRFDSWGIDRKENLLKVQDMKKWCNRLAKSGHQNRPLEVDAYTNPTTIPRGESPLA